MLSAAVGVTDEDDAYRPRSVQQAPGKRGERPPSYRSGQAAMHSKLHARATPTSTPTSVWLIAFTLLMGGLYLFHALYGVSH